MVRTPARFSSLGSCTNAGKTNPSGGDRNWKNEMMLLAMSESTGKRDGGKSDGTGSGGAGFEMGISVLLLDGVVSERTGNRDGGKSEGLAMTGLASRLCLWRVRG